MLKLRSSIAGESARLQSARLRAGCLLDVCGLVSQLSREAQQRLAGPLVARLEALLHPPSSSSKAHSLPPPNDHVLALRCLGVLPPRLWDTVLGHAGMRTIMEGLHSPDDTLRVAVSGPRDLGSLQTLRLLHKLSAELLEATLRNHLDNIRSSTELALPLGILEDLPIEQKVQKGVEETAARALEVVQVQYASIEDPALSGRSLAKGVLDICTAMEHSGRQRAVWEAGLRTVLDMLRSGESLPSSCHPAAFADGSARELVLSLRGGDTQRGQLDRAHSVRVAGNIGGRVRHIRRQVRSGCDRLSFA